MIKKARPDVNWVAPISQVDLDDCGTTGTRFTRRLLHRLSRRTRRHVQRQLTEIQSRSAVKIRPRRETRIGVWEPEEGTCGGQGFGERGAVCGERNELSWTERGRTHGFDVDWVEREEVCWERENLGMFGLTLCLRRRRR